MIYVRYTLVDAVTKVPCTQEPMTNGPVHPDGIAPTFGIEDSFGPQPQFYGVTEDREAVKDWMDELTDEEFFQAFKTELSARARKKRKQVEQGGIEFGETALRTDIESQNRIAGLVTSLQTMPDLQEVDFEAQPGKWVKLTREEAMAIGVAVSTHVQATFTWNRTMYDKIQAITSLEDALPVVVEITNYTGK